MFARLEPGPCVGHRTNAVTALRRKSELTSFAQEEWCC